MYDVIGDVHGQYEELHQLLTTKLGYIYSESDRVFVHPDGRKPVFIGDYIDRGPKNRKVVELVRSMEQTGLAYAIMGNHEFNAVQWATPDRLNPGEFQRVHTEDNRRQHRTFLAEMEPDPDFYRSTIAWFKSLPLFLKLDDNNFVHACWYPPAIQSLQNAGCMTRGGRLTEAGWNAAADPESPHYAPIQLLLKGPEEDLPNGLMYLDTHGHERRQARVAWWRDNATTFDEAYASLPSYFPFMKRSYTKPEGETVYDDIRRQLAAMPEGERIFIGHIAESGDPQLLSKKVCCVDYEGPHRLAAYRIGTEPGLDARNFTWVDNSPLAAHPAPAGRHALYGALIA